MKEMVLAMPGASRFYKGLVKVRFAETSLESPVCDGVMLIISFVEMQLHRELSFGANICPGPMHKKTERSRIGIRHTQMVARLGTFRPVQNQTCNPEWIHGQSWNLGLCPGSEIGDLDASLPVGVPVLPPNLTGSCLDCRDLAIRQLHVAAPSRQGRFLDLDHLHDLAIRKTGSPQIAAEL